MVVIVTPEGKRLTLNRSFMIQGLPVEREVPTLPVIGRNGEIVNKKQIRKKTKVIPIKGMIYGDTPEKAMEEYILLNEILNTIEDCKLYINDKDKKYFKVKYNSIDHSFVEGTGGKVMNVAITFSAYDPAWYGEEETKEFTITETNTIVSLENIGEEEVDPLVYIKPISDSITLTKDFMVLRAGNLCTNASFEVIENNVPINWVTSNTPKTTYLNPKKGSVAVLCEDAISYYSQKIKVIPNRFYRVGVYINRLQGEGELTIPLVQWLDSSDTMLATEKIIVNPVNNEYTWYEIIEKAPETAVYANIIAGNIENNVNNIVLFDCITAEYLGYKNVSDNKKDLEERRYSISFKENIKINKEETVFAESANGNIRRNASSLLIAIENDFLLHGFTLQKGVQIIEFSCLPTESYKVYIKYVPKYL